MKFFKKKQLTKTPMEEMRCKHCDRPIPPVPVTKVDNFFYEKQVILQYRLLCRGCGKINIVNG